MTTRTSAKPGNPQADYLQQLYETAKFPDVERPYFNGVDNKVKLVEETIEKTPGNTRAVRMQIDMLRKNDDAFNAYFQGSPQESEYFEFVEFSGLKTLPKPEWLVYDMLPTKGINFLYGKPGCGKTFVAIGAACAIASEEEQWLGRITKHGHVVYIAAEDIDEVAQRALAWAKHNHVDDLPNLHFFPCPLSLAKETSKFIESLDHHYPDAHFVLFVVDTLAMCSLGVDENSKKEFDAVIQSLETLWRKYECCVMVIHHSGKNGEMRGHSSMDAVGYSKIEVSEVDDNVMLKSIKKRRGKKFDDIYLDRTLVQTGDLDELLEPAKTCVLVLSDRSADAEPTRLTKLQQEILEHVRSLGGKEVARSELMKACMIDSRDKAKERSFINATSGLLKKDLITMTKQKQRTYYGLVEKDTKQSEVSET